MSNVILYDNRHAKDSWNGAKAPITTWVLLEDNGTQDGGAILAEFREREHAIAFCAAMRWQIT